MKFGPDFGRCLDRSAVHIWRFRLGRHTGNVASSRRASGLALRSVLSKYLGCPPSDVEIAYTASGKPHLQRVPATGVVPLHFNLSRSGGLGVVAVTSIGPLGVDLERVRPIGDVSRMAERFFAPSEAAAIFAERESDKLSAFYRCWTRKEAYAKAVGKGLAIPFDRFAVSVGTASPPAIVWLDGEDPSHWSLHTFSPWAGHVGACAIRTPLPDPAFVVRDVILTP